MQAAARGRPMLTDILGLVAMQGQAEHVARVGLGLTRATWSDADLWRPCINVVFGKTTMGANNCLENFARTRLIVYLELGRADLVELALSYGADPNLSIVFFSEDVMHTVRTPLQAAIKKKTYSLVRLLLKHGADPNQFFNRLERNYISSEQTLLELASEMGSLPLVRLLVDEYGVKIPGAFPPDQVVSFAKIPYCNPLASAIRNSHLSMVRYFVETKGVCVNHLDTEIFSWSEEEQKWDVEEADIDGRLMSYLQEALCAPAAAIRLEMVTYLLDAGAVVNFFVADVYQSPLHYSVVKQRFDIVVLLLARGADSNLAEPWDQTTPIIAAAKVNNLPMATVLVGAGANVLASTHWEDDDFEDIHCMMMEGYTALHHFAKHSNAGAVALMLQNGAEIDALTLTGLTPLLLAVKASSHLNLNATMCSCQCLVGAGADVNHVRVLPGDFFEFDNAETLEQGFTALTYATELGLPSLVACLLKLGASFTHCTEHSYSLLMRAAAKGHFEVLAILVAAAQSLPRAQLKAFLNMKYHDDGYQNNEWNGCNALHICLKTYGVRSNKARCARILIDACVSVQQSAHVGGKTTLGWARETTSSDVVKMVQIASHLAQTSCIDIDVVSWQTRDLGIGGAPWPCAIEVNALCFLAMSGLKNLCGRFCARLTTAQIDQAYKCEVHVECVGSDGVGHFEVRSAHYSALTLAMQHSEACAQTLIEHGASPLAPSPLSGLPDLSLATSPLAQAVERGNRKLASLLATSLLRRGFAESLLGQAVKSASFTCAAELLSAMKRRPNSSFVFPPLTPKFGKVGESLLVDALRGNNLRMARAMVASMDARQLAMTDPAPKPREVGLRLEVKVPLYVHSSPWIKASVSLGRMVPVNFLGWNFDYCIPHGAAPGQTITVEEAVTWCPPPPSALDVALRLLAAPGLGEVHRGQLLGIAETLLARTCRLVDSPLDLLVYCAQLGPRAREIFNLVSTYMPACGERGRDRKGSGGEEEDGENEEDAGKGKEQDPFNWERAVRNDFPCTGNDKVLFVGLMEGLN